MQEGPPSGSGGLSSKLSKHVLGMKFMRKTKDQLETHSSVPVPVNQSLSNSGDKLPSSSSASSLTPKNVLTIVEEVPSYSAILGWSFGRSSYGGFNPTVEYHVKKGHWKAVHLAELETGLGSLNNSSDLEDGDGEPKSKRMKMDVGGDDSDEDEEEGGGGPCPIVGSIIGTAGKQLMKNRKRKSHLRQEEDEAEDGEIESENSDSEESYEEIPIQIVHKQNKRGGRGGWANNQKGFRKPGDFDSQNETNQRTRRNQRRNQKRKNNKNAAAAAAGHSNTSGPSSSKSKSYQHKDKKMKFMKPSD